jgi:hypothetical protein
MNRAEQIKNLLSQLQELNLTMEELALYGAPLLADDEVEYEENIIFDF